MSKTTPRPSPSVPKDLPGLPPLYRKITQAFPLRTKSDQTMEAVKAWDEAVKAWDRGSEGLGPRLVQDTKTTSESVHLEPMLITNS